MEFFFLSASLIQKIKTTSSPCKTIELRHSFPVGRKLTAELMTMVFLFFCLFQVSHAMSMNYVKVSPTSTLKEAIKLMHDNKESCVLVLDAEDLIEGILTLGDIQRGLSKESDNDPNSDSVVVDVCSFKILELI